MSKYIEETADSNNVSIRAVTRILNISRSGFKSWKHRKKSHQQLHKELIKEMILTIYHKNKEIYGAPKITYILRQKGIKISMKTVSNYMREMGIKACYIKHWTKTTISKNFTADLKNLLKREFNPDRPNAFWCTDITYIWTYDEGFVYLTNVMDLYSRKIIAWTLSRTLEVEEVLKCIEMARKRRKTANPVIIHSDRGVYYTSKLYKKLTAGLILSYSKKGTPWDNACIESFHSVIKREWLNRTLIYDYDHAYDLCFEYIETFYNTIRIHSHCGYESPNQYENNYYSKH